eukprot:sb/3467138/
MEDNNTAHSNTSSPLVSPYNTRARNGRRPRNAGQYTEMDGSDSDSDSFQGVENYETSDSEALDDYDVADVLVQTLPIETQSVLSQAEEKVIRTEIELQERFGANSQPPKIVEFRCKCLDGFPTEEELHEHIRTMHPVENFKCIACPISFDSRSALDAHIYTHIVVKPYQCKICQQGFSTRKNLTRHQKQPPSSCKKFTEEGSKVKDFKCMACPMSYDTRTALDAHLHTHIGSKVKRSNQPVYTGVPRKRAKVAEKDCTTEIYNVEEAGSLVSKRSEPTNESGSSCPVQPTAKFDNTTQAPETATKEIQ